MRGSCSYNPGVPVKPFGGGGAAEAIGRSTETEGRAPEEPAPRAAVRPNARAGEACEVCGKSSPVVKSLDRLHKGVDKSCVVTSLATTWAVVCMPSFPAQAARLSLYSTVQRMVVESKYAKAFGTSLRYSTL